MIREYNMNGPMDHKMSFLDFFLRMVAEAVPSTVATDEAAV